MAVSSSFTLSLPQYCFEYKLAFINNIHFDSFQFFAWFPKGIDWVVALFNL